MDTISKAQEPYIVDPEDLAYWYFRLNGFLTIKNFVVHPDKGRRQRTDVDIIACRFPYRAELITQPMIDDSRLINTDQRILIYLAEAKQRTCNLNGPWTDKDQRNMQLVLKALGVFPQDEIEGIANCLYASGIFKNNNYHISLLCLGSQENRERKKSFPEVPQITWKHVLEFIYQRFSDYREQKVNHPQWDQVGIQLFKIAIECSNSKNQFVQQIEIKT